MKWLSAIIGGMLLLALVVTLVKGIPILSVLPVMVILFMNAIPVALTVLFSVSNAIGAKQLLKEGVLVTRMNAPNDAANMDVFCLDKTGTLTANRLTLAGCYPAEGFTDRDLLVYGTQASQEADQDAIDMAFIDAACKQTNPLPAFNRQSFTPFSPETRRTEAVIRDGEKRYTVYKGAFDVIARMAGTDTSEESPWGKK